MQASSFNQTLNDQDYEQSGEAEQDRDTSDNAETPMTQVIRGASFGSVANQWGNPHFISPPKESEPQPLLSNPIKNIVSKNKKRFVWADYDLDLAYITDNIIAMGFPSSNIEAMYRNSLDQVQGFLDARHPNHYKVYNLCAQRKYSKDKFKGNFVEYPFEDHNSPPFELIFKCCADMEQWLGKDKLNVLAIHCKAGKGRTGLIICCYLLFCKYSPSSEKCLKYYGEMRTKDGKGVTIQSQRRYIRYFQQAMKQNWTLQKYLSIKRKSKITKIGVTSAPRIHVFGGCTPWVHISSRSDEYKSKYNHQLASYQTGQQFQMKINHSFFIRDDFRLTFYSKGQILNKSSQFMRIWLNLKFIYKEELEIPANEIDGVKGDDKRFNHNMKVTVYFNHAVNQQ